MNNLIWQKKIGRLYGISSFILDILNFYMIQELN